MTESASNGNVEVDLDIGAVAEKDLRNFPDLARTIHEHLNRPVLRDKDVTRIVIGVLKEGDYWYEPHLQQMPESWRFGGVSFERHRAVTHSYDSDTQTLDCPITRVWTPSYEALKLTSGLRSAPAAPSLLFGPLAA